MPAVLNGSDVTLLLLQVTVWTTLTTSPSLSWLSSASASPLAPLVASGSSLASAPTDLST